MIVTPHTGNDFLSTPFCKGYVSFSLEYPKQYHKICLTFEDVSEYRHNSVSMVLKHPCRSIHIISKICEKKICRQKEVTINCQNRYRQSEECSKTNNVTVNLLKMTTIQKAIWKDSGYVTVTMHALIMIVLVNQSMSRWEAWIDKSLYNIVTFGFQSYLPRWLAIFL